MFYAFNHLYLFIQLSYSQYQLLAELIRAPYYRLGIVYSVTHLVESATAFRELKHFSNEC
jgi:hypothetical protein